VCIVVSVYFVIDSVRKFLDTPSCIENLYNYILLTGNCYGNQIKEAYMGRASRTHGEDDKFI